MEEENIIRPMPQREGGVAYSLAALLALLISLVLSIIVGAVSGGQTPTADWYLYLGYLLPQVAIAATCVVYLRRTKQPVKEFYRPAKWYYFPIALLLQFGLLFSLNFLNDYFIDFLEYFGYKASMESTIPTLTGWNLLPAILVIALLPAIFEESLFRGVIFGSMEKSGWGTLKAVLLSGALFSLFHGNPEQTIYQFLCGAAFALLAQRSGSILPGILAHFLNNAVILSLSSFGVDMEAMSLGGSIAIYVLSGVCLVGSIMFLLLEKKNVKGKLNGAKMFFLTASVGIAICAIEWAVVLIGGFTA